MILTTNSSPKNAVLASNSRLQTGLCFCNLQTGCKLEPNKNNHLGQIADCNVQFATRVCNLTKNPVTTRPADLFPDCTQTPSTTYIQGTPSRPCVYGLERPIRLND